MGLAWVVGRVGMGLGDPNFFIHDIHSLSIATIHLLHGGVQLANVVMTK